MSYGMWSQWFGAAHCERGQAEVADLGEGPRTWLIRAPSRSAPGRNHPPRIDPREVGPRTGSHSVTNVGAATGNGRSRADPAARLEGTPDKALLASMSGPPSSAQVSHPVLS